MLEISEYTSGISTGNWRAAIIGVKHCLFSVASFRQSVSVLETNLIEVYWQKFKVCNVAKPVLMQSLNVSFDLSLPFWLTTTACIFHFLQRIHPTTGVGQNAKSHFCQLSVSHSNSKERGLRTQCNGWKAKAELRTAWSGQPAIYIGFEPSLIWCNTVISCHVIIGFLKPQDTACSILQFCFLRWSNKISISIGGVSLFEDNWHGSHPDRFQCK